MPSSNTDLQTILFLAANPKDTGHLRLDQELRDIAEGLQRAQKRDQFNLEQRLAVRPRDIQLAMLEVGPQIIHFSGHGEGEQGLVFEDEIGNAKLVDGAALAGLFELFVDQITCVVLNGCYSEVQAKAIAQHIPYVIGMNQTIGDKAAIAFAVGFYDALGAGRPIDFAYKLGCSAIRMEGIAENLTPVLLKQSTTGDAIVRPKPSVPSPSDSPVPSTTAIVGILLAVFAVSLGGLIKFFPSNSTGNTSPHSQNLDDGCAYEKQGTRFTNPKNEDKGSFDVCANDEEGTKFTNSTNEEICITFKANGRWIAEPGRGGGDGSTDAAGYMTEDGKKSAFYRNSKNKLLPAASLIVMRKNQTSQPVGEEKTLTLEPKEAVKFLMNDIVKQYIDNQGKLTVKWFINRQGKCI